MEAASRTPDMIVVGGDEEGRLQVRPVMEGGSRSVELHLWRPGTSEAPPARDVLDLDLPDLDSLQLGISELIEASEGGTRVARIVLDTAEGRRLRLETEPFGTRFVARVVFWQRTRVTWRPDGDPIVLPAELLPRLHDALAGLRTWLDEPLDRQMTAAIPIVPEPWPNPGADWLTVDRSSVAFHPRGVRITCSIEETGEHHAVEVRQWRREDSLWVPERVVLALSPGDLDALLAALHQLSGTTDPTSVEAGEKLRVSITGDPPDLVIDQRINGDFQRSLAFPLEHLPRFGRALSQSWTLLAGWLSDSEREQLREEHPIDLDDTVSMPAVTDSSAPPTSPEPIGPTFRFGAESDTPGTVIPQDGRVRIVLEGVLMPRGVTLPANILADVITGLEELNQRQETEWRVEPLLMYERPDCTVYGRVGTNARPDAAELRVWTSPRNSDAVTFDKIYLPEVIEALRESARLLGEPEPLPVPPAPVEPVRASWHKPSSLDTSVTVPQVAAKPEPEPVHVGVITAGSMPIQLDLKGPEDEQRLTLSWEGGAIDLEPDGLDTVLSDVRTLYYDALRGRRGRFVRLEDPPLEAGLHNRGTTLYLELRGPEATLAFPASEIPGFLNAIRAAMNI